MKKIILLILFLSVVGLNAYVLFSPKEGQIKLSALTNQALAGGEFDMNYWNSIYGHITLQTYEDNCIQCAEPPYYACATCTDYEDYHLCLKAYSGDLTCTNTYHVFRTWCLGPFCVF
jgi:hypothetical protein